MTARLWLGLPNRDGSLPGHAQRLYDAGQIAGAMVSAGALFEGGRFHELGCVYDDLPVVLDSAGFVGCSSTTTTTARRPTTPPRCPTGCRTISMRSVHA